MTILSQRTVCTRKAHKCQACGRSFSAGTTMNRTAQVDGGEIASAYWCITCQAFMQTLDSWDLDFGFDGDIWEYDGYETFRAQREKS